MKGILAASAAFFHVNKPIPKIIRQKLGRFFVNYRNKSKNKGKRSIY